MIQINEAMNLVVPVVTDEAGVRVWGYHTPISRAVFEANYRVLAATKASLTSKGAMYMMDAGPLIAALTLRDEGLREAAARGLVDKDGAPVDLATPALLAEIRRLTMVLVPTAAGWDLLPLESAVSAGKIDDEDQAEVESAVVFFTCIYALASKAERKNHANRTASLLKGSITSLPPLEFSASLPTSTKGATSAPAVVSSVPS
ncbi:MULTISPECIES: hypothetical protein [Burkholderia]|uniref:hypothetical protein n=1 Tax=Burkholderia TaxID=32008 RepID=UPI000756D0AA|nr:MULTISPECIES: hypothetical protein [Burkholderia]AOJ70869.1 hypothetical protein WS78_11660 [Burkholderia savannae]KVG37455.1 hypothetical protein WS77_01890 [Burkholderia sp. MSMB0265]KVG88281.1 hypothetical protein WS81_25335 [Burkholderia sp. MSMB2040]KVG93832.1 hypothetical protein WS82_08830 [Burkholderia sp. MSMB2041]KVH01084.1 hypothetical protein WS83_20390 [Burkholderia sp. MSMB2042]